MAATPERLSVAVNFTVTSPVCQPVGALAVVVGSCRSILMPLTVAPVVLPALSVTEAPAERLLPSPVSVLSAGAAPARPDRASAAVQRTVTSPLYQPLPFGP